MNKQVGHIFRGICDIPEAFGDDTPRLNRTLPDIKWGEEADISKFFPPFEKEISPWVRQEYDPHLMIRRSLDEKLIYLRIVRTDVRKHYTADETIVKPDQFEGSATQMCRAFDCIFSDTPF